MISAFFLELTAYLAACQGSAPQAALSTIEEALAAGVSEERAAQRVRELCALGPRMGGTFSGQAAAELRARWFLDAGLEVETRLDTETWCHEPKRWRLFARASALDGEESGESATLERAWPWGFSPSAKGEARLALEAAEGAALLTSRLPRRRARAAGAQPTPALALVDGSNNVDGSYPLAMHLPEGDENPYPVFGISQPEGELLHRWLAEGREVWVEHELETVIARARPRTVVARLPGRAGAPPGYFLFCAHGDSDSGGPGANDNASGEAVVLEIATAFAGEIAAGRVPPPPRELRFAIWGKEIHSTRDFLARAADEKSPLLGVLNYDQAGFGSGADQLNVEPDDLPANVSLVMAIVSVLRDAEGRPDFPRHWATNKSLGGTDSYVFSDSPLFREGGHPSVTVFSSAWGEPAEHPRTPEMPGESWRERDMVQVDYDLYYHSAGDTPENTTDREPYNMAWCARVGMLGALRWLEAL